MTRLEQQARYGVGSRRAPADLEWSRFRVSAANLKRIERASAFVYLGRNGAGDDCYNLEGTPYRLFFRSFPRPTRAGKLGQVYLAPRAPLEAAEAARREE
jgi:hypothetical protein